MNNFESSIETLNNAIGCATDSEAVKDLELAIKAIETMNRIADVIKIEQQPTSCEHTKIKSFELIERIVTDYQLASK